MAGMTAARAVLLAGLAWGPGCGKKAAQPLAEVKDATPAQPTRTGPIELLARPLGLPDAAALHSSSEG